MVRHLRKGHSSVYLQFDNDGSSIGAEAFQVEVQNNVVIIRFTLRPVDGNQKSDEENLHSKELKSVQISDDYIIENLSEFLKEHSKNCSEMRLEIWSKGKNFVFAVEFGAAGINFLPLLVSRIVA